MTGGNSMRVVCFASHDSRRDSPSSSSNAIVGQSGIIHDGTQNTGHGLGQQHIWDSRPQDWRRRLPSSQPDQVKHRRTRRGCFTCRSRRVKCDERRPICERCSKGNRECNYPENRQSVISSVSPTGDAHEQSVAENSSLSPIESHETLEEEARLPRSNHASSLSTNSKGRTTRDFNDSVTENTQSCHFDVCVKLDSSRSPSNETSLDSQQSEESSSTSFVASCGNSAWSHLPSDVQYYLEYHQKHITHNQLFFKQSIADFLGNILVEQALTYDPLLYAIVGFAAFHFAVQRHIGKIQDFLGYYDKSVSLLRESLVSGQSYTNATLLTTLQLALFEEYLGDFVSLLGHQKAAYYMLTELYSPESVMTTELGRCAIEWYTRFELTSGLMSENVTTLGPEWFQATEKWYQAMCVQYPGHIDHEIRWVCARHRTLWADLASLYAKLAKDPLTSELQKEGNRCATLIDQWMTNLNPILRDERFLVKDFQGRLANSDDIVDPYLEIWRGPLFAMNFVFLDWSAMSMLFKMKMSQALQVPPPPELETLALEACRVFETIEYWPESPAGSILKAKSVLGMACLFLPKDERHTMWCRKKLAQIERLGHVYPQTFRERMAKIWNLPEVKDDWWIPDEDLCPLAVRSIRSCMVDRLPLASIERRSRDQRNMKGIFSNLKLDDEVDVTLGDKNLWSDQN